MSDHFPDATKMVSDTPRTNGCLTAILDTYGYVHQGNCPQRWVNHSRELERELNAANQRIKRLEREVELLRLYGNKDCTSQADEVLKKEAKP